jgi:hypothetical protein
MVTEFLFNAATASKVRQIYEAEYHDRGQASLAKSLSLEFVHGYRAHDTRNNLFYLNTGELVYHVAAVGVAYDTKTKKQRFFFEHTDDIVRYL